MARRCPPGVICIENITVIFLIFAIAIAGWFYHAQSISSGQRAPVVVQREVVRVAPRWPGMVQPRFNRGFTNSPQDVLLNPYTPPLKNDGWFPPDWAALGGVPINTPTRGYDVTYRQLGLLTRLNGKETILPLMGRPLHANHNKWQFYTMSDKNNIVKLPISRNGRSCTSEYGCKELFNGDTVYVEGYKDAFRVTLYDNQVPRYIPFL